MAWFLAAATTALLMTAAWLLAWHAHPHAISLEKPWPPHQADISEHAANATFIPTDSTLPDTGFQLPVPEFRDPFYAFVIGIAEGDSLGLWTSHHLQTYLEHTGQHSLLPLEYFESLERQAVDDTGSEYRRGVYIQRMWRLTLNEPLRYPMPYSVLGYNLGSLSMAKIVTFSEWRLGNRNVHVPLGKEISVIPVTGLMVFRLDSGWIVMDVHGWLDKLLGGKVDDCWTQGFALCRQDGEMRGLALSCNRKLRPLCGEIDFATNEITPAAGPFTRGVAVYVRPWIAPPESDASRAWQFDR